MLLNILLGVMIVIGAAMTGVILLQRSEGGGLVSSGGGQMLSARGAGNFLTKATQILALGFFVLALSITILTGRIAGTGSITDKLEVEGIDPTTLQQQMAPPAAEPAEPLELPDIDPLDSGPSIDLAPANPAP
jgi:preprotein translocase subunit SecG